MPLQSLASYSSTYLYQMLFQVRLFPDVDAYSPGQSVSLSMETESRSWVALTAVDSAVYSVQRTAKKPLERVKSSSLPTYPHFCFLSFH